MPRFAEEDVRCLKSTRRATAKLAAPQQGGTASPELRTGAAEVGRASPLHRPRGIGGNLGDPAEAISRVLGFVGGDGSRVGLIRLL